jgi:tetratricopeptide (TPR) repeat protein
VLAELDVDKLPWPHRFRLLRQRAGCLARRGQFAVAAALNESLADQTKEPDEIVEARGAAAELYATIRQFDKAQAALHRLDAHAKSNAALAEAARAYQRVVEELLEAGRRKEALALCGSALQQLGARETYGVQNLLRRLIAATTDDEGELFDVVAALDGKAALAVASDEALDQLAPIAARARRGDDLVKVCTHAMLARPFDESTARVCLGAIVDVRTRQGRLDEALAAARAAYAITGFESASTTYFVRAVAIVAHALRARDGHLVSGNAFRSYQAYGPNGPDRKPGTADDIANPLAGLEPKPDPELDPLFQAALDRQPPTTTGWRTRGWICLLWSKPKEALGAFKQAFAVCSLDSNALTRAAQDVALGLKALHGTPVGMDAFATFQRYGPAGPDRKEGTNDDLKDPLAGL